MAWNDLTIAQRSQLINIFRQNGVTELPEMRRKYDLLHPSSSLEEEPSVPIHTAPTYATGGPEKGMAANAKRLKTAEPAGDNSLNAYISKMLNTIRQNALEKSRTRTMPRYVSTEGWAVQPEPAKNDEYIQGLVEDIETAIRNADAYANAKNAEDAVQNYGMRSSIQPFINSDDRSEREHARLSELRIAQNLKKVKEEEENNDSGAWNCLATATDNYGPQYVESSNPIFAKNPQKYGFLQIPVADAEPGDIIQHTVYDTTYGKGEPHHALILNRYDDAGRARFNYSTGVYTKDAIVKDGGYFPPVTVPFDDNNYNAFRFVGTPADSLKWRQEYEKVMQKQKAQEYASGGTIHIKPENRGKFTALKERTGHSASWFKENGTPAQRKMATFALNAAKWKHADGGPIKKYVTELTPEEETSFTNWYKNYAGVHNLSPNPDEKEHYYDYRGYWKNTPDFKKLMDLIVPSRHLPDTWKTPGHDTFSTESMYYKYAPGLAGHWEGDTFIPPEKVDLDEIKLRQRYAESAFNDAAISPAGAKGAWQIMPATYNEYSKKMSKTGNLLDPKFNEEMRDFIWNDLYNSYTASVNNPLDKVRVAKALAMYNRGRGAVGDWLAEQKKKGVDIYGSLDWVDNMPWKETRDYVNFILLGKDIPDSSKTEKAYRDSVEKHGYNKTKKSSIRTRAIGGFIENFMAPHIKK